MKARILKFWVKEEAKTKALISFAVTAKLIRAFGFAYADYWFSHEVAHLFVPGMQSVAIACSDLTRGMQVSEKWGSPGGMLILKQSSLKRKSTFEMQRETFEQYEKSTSTSFWIHYGDYRVVLLEFVFQNVWHICRNHN